MPSLYFIPTARISLLFSVNDKESTYFLLPIKIQKERECVIKETGQDLSLLDGRIKIYSDYSDIAKDLKSEGFIGIFAYHEGDEQDFYNVEVHLPQDEFDGLVRIISRKNHINSISIETPLKDENLTHSLDPDEPDEWSTKDQGWVPIEKCDFFIKFND